MSHFEFERKSFDGLSLYFQGWQPDEGSKGVICLVHGLGEHSDRYAHWASRLNLAGYALLAFDLRGHGKSGGQRGHATSFDDYVKDTDILLKEADNKFPGKSCFLYGHSLGGLIVNYYVLKKKPKLAGVIVTALANKTSLQEQKAKILLSKILGSIAPTMTIQTGLVPSTICRDPEVVERYINLLKSGGNDYPMEQLKKAGVDLTKPEVVKSVIDRMNELVSLLEQEINKL